MKRIRLLSDVECEALRAAWKDRPNDRVRQQRAQAVYLAGAMRRSRCLPCLKWMWTRSAPA